MTIQDRSVFGRAFRLLLGALLALQAAAACAYASAPTAPAPTSPPPRRTWLVDLYENARQSVVLLETVEDMSPPARPATQPTTQPVSKPAAPRPATTRTHWGTGVLIHPDGYILTNSHCFRFDGRRRAKCPDGQTRDVIVLADEPDFDLALGRVIWDKPFTPMKLGRSSDLMIGEQAITLGNPFGIGLTLSLGIVSGLNRSTRTDYANLSGMIQTEAGTNAGTSGGPLLNVNGELIGIVTSRKTEGDNLGFAIPVDTAWRRLPEMLCDWRQGTHLGLKLTAGPGEVKIEQVTKGSPAEAAGLKAGDVILGVGGQDFRNGVDGLVALARLKCGQPAALRLRREGKIVEGKVTPLTMRFVPPQTPEPKLLAGLRYQWFSGKWSKLPDFSALKPAGEGTMDTITLGNLGGKRPLALRAWGYLKAPQDGVYTFWLNSTEGSRLEIDSTTVVDNDGAGSRTCRVYAALKAGCHPITLTYFCGGGEPSLGVYWECPGQPRRTIPAAALFQGPPGSAGEPAPSSRPAPASAPSRAKTQPSRKVIRGLW